MSIASKLGHPTGKEKLEKVQRMAVNIVAELKGKTYEDKLKEGGLTSLEDRRNLGDMIQDHPWT